MRLTRERQLRRAWRFGRRFRTRFARSIRRRATAFPGMFLARWRRGFASVPATLASAAATPAATPATAPALATFATFAAFAAFRTLAVLCAFAPFRTRRLGAWRFRSGTLTRRLHVSLGGG